MLALVALAGGGAADAAHAGTASGRPAQFTAGPGESNDVTVDAGSGAAVQFTDAAELIVPALPWCTPFPLGQALCDPDGDPRDTDGGGVGVDLGDRDDRAVIRWVPGTGFRPGRITVTAGAGDDHVESSAKGSIRFAGGDGDDRLIIGPAADAVLRGGGGADLTASSATAAPRQTTATTTAQAYASRSTRRRTTAAPARATTCARAARWAALARTASPATTPRTC